MLRGKLQRLERKLSTLELDCEQFPQAIIMRVMGCFHPNPKKILVSSAKGAASIFRVCGTKEGDCRKCEHFHPERLRAS